MKKRCLIFPTVSVFCWCLLLTSLFPSMLKAAPMDDYRIEILPASAELVLMFSYPVKYDVWSTNQNRVIDFDRAVNISDLEIANKRLSFWVKNISASYDRLILQLQPGVEIDLSVDGYNLSIVFRLKKSGLKTKGSRKHEEHSAAPINRRSNNLALERVGARLDLESGLVVEARDRYKALLELYPTSTQLMLDLASVEEKLHNWREALRLYRQAEVLMPHSLPITWAKQSLLRTYGSRVSATLNYNKIGNDYRQIKAEVQGRQLLEKGHVWFVDYALWDVENDFATRRINGEVKPFDGQRNSLRLGVETLFYAGEQTLSFFMGENHPGLAWGYQWANNSGLFGVELDWRVPWFETSEAMADSGSRHRLAIKYEKVLSSRLGLNSSVSINSYGLDDVDNVVKSFRLQIDTRYKLPGLAQKFSVGYSLDKETFFSRTERVDIGNVPFIILPLDSHEQHVFILGWENKFSDRTIFESYFGYEYDRLRKADAPFVRLHLSYRPKPRLEMNANIETGLSTYNEGSDDFLSVGGNVSWFF
jgi:tetratricopeptide (TPR) repeat protein